jgi:riboflavin biosynthesis pyrimidine reductase
METRATMRVRNKSTGILVGNAFVLVGDNSALYVRWLPGTRSLCRAAKQRNSEEDMDALKRAFSSRRRARTVRFGVVGHAG